ncbi:hypothetical protein [Cyclobacterium amurskyense]|uniref:Uncharacterized protein n=1 Tax=Cyclobacterium amurskyense TaxID=320787 RepID=A0A0H4PR29_9BACT|nr:hypothetical protein [Cyclobacterium amurskyense]AKP50737.1 hypothetical protein CA2015_1289 [Cyclobacterium amurskyense]
MAVSRNDKEQIVKAYFEKSIAKKEVESLLINGKAIAPKEWVYSNEEERIKQEQKRELISRVFGYSISEIEWVIV